MNDQTIQVSCPNGTSTVVIGENLLDSAGKLLNAHLPETIHRIVLVSDDRVMDLYGQRILHALGAAGQPVHWFSIPPGDQSKSLDLANGLYGFLAREGVGRDGLLVALGGGVVSDLTGFVAATWMRGIPYATFTTTLEGAIDASIGGKTGINLVSGKNLVGAFHHAGLVVVDCSTFGSLPDRDWRAGLAESIKHALLDSEALFGWHEQCAGELVSRDPGLLVELVRRNIEVKKRHVESDPTERTERRILLNLGHTVGHAIEAAGAYSLRHGECVALGLVAEARIASAVSILAPSIEARVSALVERCGLPREIPREITMATMLQRMGTDKKVRAGRLRFVLLEGIGRPVVRDDISADQVEPILERMRA